MKPGRERYPLPLLPDALQRVGGALEALALAPQELDHLVLQHSEHVHGCLHHHDTMMVPLPNLQQKAGIELVFACSALCTNTKYCPYPKGMPMQPSGHLTLLRVVRLVGQVCQQGCSPRFVAVF